jgi:hypothetical protein
MPLRQVEKLTGQCSWRFKVLTFFVDIQIIDNTNLQRWVGLGIKPDFFIYLVKAQPESDLSPTYLVMFSSPRKKPEQEV